MNAIEKRASEARAILDSPLFKAAYKALEERIVAKMYAVNPTDLVAHTRCIDALKALKLVQGAMQAHIASGEIAAADLEHQLEPKRGLVASLRRLRD